jgi:hypothetical protein
LIRIQEVAGKIITHLEAFNGSKAAMDTPQILIVRGISRKRVKPEDLGKLLSETLESVEAQRVEMVSEEAVNLIGIMDENIRASVDIPEETDIQGIYRLKESFESINCHLEYSLATVGNVGLFLILWKDKSGVGPVFVELVVSNLNVGYTN